MVETSILFALAIVLLALAVLTTRSRRRQDPPPPQSDSDSPYTKAKREEEERQKREREDTEKRKRDELDNQAAQAKAYADGIVANTRALVRALVGSRAALSRDGFYFASNVEVAELAASTKEFAGQKEGKIQGQRANCIAVFERRSRALVAYVAIFGLPVAMSYRRRSIGPQGTHWEPLGLKIRDDGKMFFFKSWDRPGENENPYEASYHAIVSNLLFNESAPAAEHLLEATAKFKLR